MFGRPRAARPHWGAPGCALAKVLHGLCEQQKALTLGTLDDSSAGVARCHVLELGDRDYGGAGRPVAVVARKRDQVVLLVMVANDQRR